MTAHDTELHRLYVEDRVTFHEKFLKLVEKIVAQTAYRYPIDVYNNNLKWNSETCTEIVQDVYEKRLLDEKCNQLVYIMSEAKSIESIERLLKKQIKQIIVGRARKSPIDNLKRRIRQMADTGEIKMRKLQGVTYIAASTASKVEPIEVRESDLRNAINLARQEPILWGKPDSQRESKLYTSEGLRRVIAAILSAIPCISESDLFRILENLLTPFVPSNLYIGEELGDIDVEQSDVILMVDMDDQVRLFVDALEVQEVAVLVAKSQGKTDEQTAENLGLTRQTIHKRKSQIEAKMIRIFKELGSSDSTDVISRRIIELATIRLADEEGPR